ncbi:MAG: hypothetical protein CM15mP101_04040 [Flavobacteriaceae bacterium]|nr:MAG: hypothetical protein CM15mP101_04040 [Flavobacteriaceae bacterium]
MSGSRKNRVILAWENPWTQIGLNDDGFPIYIVKAFEIANKYAPNVKLVYNHNGGMERKMWEKVLETSHI